MEPAVARPGPRGDDQLPRGVRLIDTAPAVLLREAWEIAAPPVAWISNENYLGKALARLEAIDGPLCLRRYPTGTSPQWLATVHATVDGLVRRGYDLIPPFIATPRGDTLVRHVGYYYDLSPWAAGESLSVETLGDDRLASLGSAVARLHLTGGDAPSLPVRLDWLATRHLTAQKLAWDSIPRGKDPWLLSDNLKSFFGPLASDDVVLRNPRASSVIGTAMAALDWIGRVGPPGADGNPPTLTHGDLWTDHVFFKESSVSALLDLDTLGQRPPTGDLAALCADFARWDPARCAALINGYRQILSIETETIERLPRLAALRTLGVLRERLRDWRNREEGSRSDEALGGPVPYWCGQLRTLAALDLRAFSSI